MTPAPAGYPLRLDGRLAVVVGGGAAAEQEALALRAAGAAVLVVAPVLGPALAALADDGLIAVRRGEYGAGDLSGGSLVVACGSPAVNAAVAADADRLRLLCVTPGAAADTPVGRVLVLGGARSGKSRFAEQLLAGQGEVEYVATGTPPAADDPEWAARVTQHRARRPSAWRTTETLDVAGVLLSADPAPVLVDCLSLWLARVMDECGAWDDDAGRENAALAGRTTRLTSAWATAGRTAVAVSNEVGSGVVPATASGRRYRDALGQLNAAFAAVSDEVWLCTAGLPRRLR